MPLFGSIRMLNVGMSMESWFQLCWVQFKHFWKPILFYLLLPVWENLERGRLEFNARFIGDLGLEFAQVLLHIERVSELLGIHSRLGQLLYNLFLECFCCALWHISTYWHTDPFTLPHFLVHGWCCWGECCLEDYCGENPSLQFSLTTFSASSQRKKCQGPASGAKVNKQLLCIPLAQCGAWTVWTLAWVLGQQTVGSAWALVHVFQGPGRMLSLQGLTTAAWVPVCPPTLSPAWFSLTLYSDRL
jgi:hypothetical protein